MGAAVRVVTWNLWWRFGAWRERRKAIRSVLRDLRPDVVGLQEVWAVDEGENLAEWLAEGLGLHWAWAPSPAPERWRRRIGGEPVDIGNAVLSRWPVREQATLLLPAPAELADGRMALYARLAAPSYDVPFFTTHLTSADDASAVRCEQVSALAEFVAAHRGDTVFPAVVTGDFNAEPDSPEVRLLGDHALYDAWTHAAPSTPSATWNPAGPNPYARIDYLHVGPPGPGGIGRVRAVRRAGAAPVAGVWPSDHTAVAADLSAG